MREAPKVEVAPGRKEELTSNEAVKERVDSGMTVEHAEKTGMIDSESSDAIRADATKGQLENKTPETATEKGGKMEALKSKIMGFFGQAPEQLSAKYSKLGEKRMEENPALIKAYENYLVTEGAKVAQAYKEALGKWKYIGRDKEGKFVDKTLYSSGTGDVPGDKQRNN